MSLSPSLTQANEWLRPQEPSVSVVISAYNKLEFLERAIRSALTQTLAPIEVIVVDDNSSESYDSLKCTFANQPVKWIRHEQNLGASAAINRGIAESQGEYVAFLDADDFWKPDKLERQYALLLTLEEASSTVISSRVEIRGPSIRRVKLRPRTVFDANQHTIPEYLLCHPGVLQTSTLFMPSTLAKTVLYDAEFRSLTDVVFCLRLYHSGARFVMHADPLTIWWESASSVRLSKIGSLRTQAIDLFLRKYSPLLSDRQLVGLSLRYANTYPTAIKSRLSHLLLITKAVLMHSISFAEALFIYIPKCFGIR